MAKKVFLMHLRTDVKVGSLQLLSVAEKKEGEDKIVRDVNYHVDYRDVLSYAANVGGGSSNDGTVFTIREYRVGPTNRFWSAITHKWLTPIDIWNDKEPLKDVVKQPLYC